VGALVSVLSFVRFNPAFGIPYDIDLLFHGFRLPSRASWASARGTGGLQPSVSQAAQEGERSNAARA
jgi:hypothetical protein